MAGAPRTTRARAACALLPVVLLVSACGGSSTGSGATPLSKRYLTAVKYARCMRAHGVPQFPDPKNPGGFNDAQINALDTSAPAFSSASTACEGVLPNDGQPTGSQYEGILLNAVKVAKCERAHGIYMPDPQMQDGHLTINMANVNPNEPGFNRIGSLCEKKVFGYN